MSSVKKKLAKIKATAIKIDKAYNKVKKVANYAGRGVKTYRAISMGDPIGAFNAIRGKGDYTVTTNSISRKGGIFSGDSVPAFRNISGGVRVTHREYLGEILASPTANAFSVTSYAVNPGLFSTFPWFSAFANQFDQWKPNGLVFCFKTESSEFGAGAGSVGTVIMAADYDVTDTAYSSKIEMENSQFACSGPCFESLMHPVECKPSQRNTTTLMTRATNNGLTSTDNSLRWYDICNFQIATAGCQANQVVGELWLSFDITLYKTQLFSGIYGKSILINSGVVAASTNGDPLGAGVTVSSNSNFFPVYDPTAQTITLPRSVIGGTFHIRLVWSGASGSSVVAPSVTYNAAITSLGVTATVGSGVASATLSIDNAFTVIDTGVGLSPVITIGTGGTLPNASTLVIFIVQINPALPY